MAPKNYVSIRITVGHDQWDEVKQALQLDSEQPYVAYPHTGNNGDNPHYHITVVTDDVKKTSERLRNRLKRNYTGNAQYSIKSMDNGILQAIQYMSKEGTDPIHEGDGTAGWIADAPEWVHKVQSVLKSRKRPRDPDTIPQITYNNMMRICRRWRLTHDIKTTDLFKILDNILPTEEYALSMTVIKGGIPQYFVDQFVEYTKEKSMQSHKCARLLCHPENRWG